MSAADNGPAQRFSDWKAKRPKGEKATESELLSLFYNEQSNKMHHYNNSATVCGRNAGWAFRALAAIQEEKP